MEVDEHVIKRVNGAKVAVPFVIGSAAQKMRAHVSVTGHNFPLTHKWTCYVRGLKNSNSLDDPVEEQDLTFLIKKVDF